eukprot:1629681-Pyramimonas_sp.AAC.1
MSAQSVHAVQLLRARSAPGPAPPLLLVFAMPAGGARSFAPQKAEKKTAGRQAWKAGEKCREFSVLHKRADFIK